LTNCLLRIPTIVLALTLIIAAVQTSASTKYEGVTSPKASLASSVETDDTVSADKITELKNFADQGAWWAQNNLAHMYADGAGVEKNLSEAKRLMFLAANNPGNSRGHPETTIGWWYLTGQHDPEIPTNYLKAYCWNRKGANKGHPNALSNLALLYSAELGVKRNFVRMAELLIESVEMFSYDFRWVLDSPDQWFEYHKSPPPNRFMKARELYLSAISTYEQKYVDGISGLVSAYLVETGQTYKDARANRSGPGSTSIEKLINFNSCELLTS
jgi:hypothetical protein